jgi:hypothetical protein
MPHPLDPSKTDRAVQGSELVQRLSARLQAAIRLLDQLGVLPPIAVALRLGHMGGVYLRSPGRMWDAASFGPEPIVPEFMLITSTGATASEILREPLNVVWNAAGYEACGYYGQDGKPMWL